MHTYKVRIGYFAYFLALFFIKFAIFYDGNENFSLALRFQTDLRMRVDGKWPVVSKLAGMIYISPVQKSCPSNKIKNMCQG